MSWEGDANGPRRGLYRRIYRSLLHHMQGMQMAHGPPAYTNARPLPHPLRFGAPPIAAHSQPPYSSQPQSPVQSPLLIGCILSLGMAAATVPLIVL